MAVWGIKKLGLIIGSSVVGVGALTGISVGAVQATHSTKVDNPDTTSGVITDPIIKPSVPSNNEGMQNDQSNPDSSSNEMNDESDQTASTINFEKYFASIKKNLTVFEKGQDKKELDKKQQFAYKIEVVQIGLKDDAEVRDEVNADFSISSANNTKTYNEGNLLVDVKLTNKKKDSETKTEQITLTGFKTVSDEFKKFFNGNSVNNETYSLDLGVDKLDSSKALFTVEDLNTKVSLFTPKAMAAAAKLKERSITEEEKKILTETAQEKKDVSSLTSFFWDKNKADQEQTIGEISIEGKAKLETIVKDNTKGVLFKLVSSSKSEPLRLVKDSKDEALVDSIYVTNIAATDVSVRPLNSKEDYAKDFKEKVSGDSGFVTNKGDADLNRDLAVNLNTMQTSGVENLLYVKPYLIENVDASGDSYKLPVEITVSFGNGNDAKTFKTSDVEQLKILTDAGFSFSVYSKKLATENMENMKAEAIKTVATEAKVFHANAHNKLTDKPITTMDKFTGTDLETATLNQKLEIEIKKEPTNGKIEGTYLLVAGYKYSFKAVPNVNNKLLFTSNLSWVDLAAKTE